MEAERSETPRGDWAAIRSSGFIGAAGSIDHEVDHRLTHLVGLQVDDFVRTQPINRTRVADLTEDDCIADPRFNQRFDVRNTPGLTLIAALDWL